MTAHIRIRKLKEQSDFHLSIWGKRVEILCLRQSVMAKHSFSFAFHVAVKLHGVPRSS
jgi:hypothetical protein